MENKYTVSESYRKIHHLLLLQGSQRDTRRDISLVFGFQKGKRFHLKLIEMKHYLSWKITPLLFLYKTEIVEVKDWISKSIKSEHSSNILSIHDSTSFFARRLKTDHIQLSITMTLLKMRKLKWWFDSHIFSSPTAADTSEYFFYLWIFLND